MPDYDIWLYVGELPAAKMTVDRPSASAVKKEARRFISQCWEFDWAEVWKAEQKMCSVHPRRLDLGPEAIPPHYRPLSSLARSFSRSQHDAH